MSDEPQNAYYQRFNWVLTIKREQELSSAAYAVLTALVMHADHRTGQCYPTEATLMREVGMSESSVKRGLRELRRKGLIRVIPSSWPNNTYELEQWAIPAGAREGAG